MTLAWTTVPDLGLLGGFTAAHWWTGIFKDGH